MGAMVPPLFLFRARHPCRTRGNRSPLPFFFPLPGERLIPSLYTPFSSFFVADRPLFSFPVGVFSPSPCRDGTPCHPFFFFPPTAECTSRTMGQAHFLFSQPSGGKTCFLFAPLSLPFFPFLGQVRVSPVYDFLRRVSCPFFSPPPMLKSFSED